MDNILPLRYALEIEQTGSISGAAKKLYMGQPHLSRAIKELETSLGITIFTRTSKGVSVTPRGREFLDRARNVLAQIDDIEMAYSKKDSVKREYDILIPPVFYMSKALEKHAEKTILNGYTSIKYIETSTPDAVNLVADGIYNIAVVRYQEAAQKDFFITLNERRLKCELIKEFSYKLLTCAKSRILSNKVISEDTLSNYVEIRHTGLKVPELDKFPLKHIMVNERAMLLNLLANMENSYTWVSDMPDSILKQLKLVLSDVSGVNDIFKDVLICRKEYDLTEYDIEFIRLIQDLQIINLS